ncbi:hypothetical protein [Paenibacillus xylanexedens]|uniref:hypothetical protein n=1 Tax=Paenibacillus xylanexedens TaxID=528191 RepID=UPI0011A23B9C
MFVDKGKIYVKGGEGGEGIIWLGGEKYVGNGGGGGGDGGRGGEMILGVDEGLGRLMDLG